MAHAYIDNTYTQSHVNKYNFKNHKTGSPEYKLGVWGVTGEGRRGGERRGVKNMHNSIKTIKNVNPNNWC